MSFSTNPFDPLAKDSGDEKKGTTPANPPANPIHLDILGIQPPSGEFQQITGTNPFASETTPAKENPSRSSGRTVYISNDANKEKKKTKPSSKSRSTKSKENKDEPAWGRTSTFNYASSDPEEEGEGHVIIQPRPLKYLYLFTEDEIKDLEDKYSLNRYALDAQVKDHKIYYRKERGLNWVAIGSDSSFTIFQIITSRDGVQSMARLINKDLKVSNTAGLTIGAPLAMMDGAFNLTAVSPIKEAIKATLEYANRESFKVRAKEFIESAKENPARAAKIIGISASCWLVNKTHDLVGGAANIIAFNEPIAFSLPLIGDAEIPALIPALPLPARWVFGLSLSYGTNRYYTQFSDPDYNQNFKTFMMKGIKDLLMNNPDGEPWMLGEVQRGNLPAAMQLILQGYVSTIAIRSFPTFYYIAIATFNKLLGMPETPAAALAAIAAFIVAWHTLCARYPKTYYRYLGDRIKIEAFLREKARTALQDDINRIVQTERHDFAVSPETIEKQKQQLINDLINGFVKNDRKILEAQIEEANAWKYPFQKEKSLALMVIFRALSGLMIGRGIAAGNDANPVSTPPNPALAQAPTFNHDPSLINASLALNNTNLIESSAVAANMTLNGTMAIMRKLTALNMTMNATDSSPISTPPSPSEDTPDSGGSLAFNIIAMTLGAAFLSSEVYFAEKNRIRDKMIWENLQRDQGEQKAAPQSGTGNKYANRLADVITVGSNASRALSLMGSADRVMGSGSTFALGNVAVIAVENMINTILFTYQKVRSTVNGWEYYAKQNRQAGENVVGTPVNMFNRPHLENPSVPPVAEPNPNYVALEDSGWRSHLPTFIRNWS